MSAPSAGQAQREESRLSGLHIWLFALDVLALAAALRALAGVAS